MQNISQTLISPCPVIERSRSVSKSCRKTAPLRYPSPAKTLREWEATSLQDTSRTCLRYSVTRA